MYNDFQAKRIATQAARTKAIKWLMIIMVVFGAFTAGWNRLWLSDYQSKKVTLPMPAPPVIADAKGDSPATMPTPISTAADPNHVTINVPLPAPVVTPQTENISAPVSNE